MLYIVYDGKPLAEGGIIKIIYTFTTASYNINAFNTSGTQSFHIFLKPKQSYTADFKIFTKNLVTLPNFSC